MCLACQESALSEKQDPLLHCADLQGVILGVGLTMLEQLFEKRGREQPVQVQDNVEVSTRNSKRRKIDTTSFYDVDDEDVDYYANVGKKQKGGIGYDGNASEDVSRVNFITYIHVIYLFRRSQAKLRLWKPKKLKMR